MIPSSAREVPPPNGMGLQGSTPLPFYYILLTTTNPPTSLPTHGGGGEHSSCISIPIPTTNCYSLLLTTTNPPTPLPTHRGVRGTELLYIHTHSYY